MESTNCVKRLTQRIRVNLQVCASSAFLTQLVLSPYALAEPTGGNIVGGSGNISQSTLTTTINQNSNRLAIDWQSFNVNQNETVNFIQPGQSSIALNRILDQKASQIHGSINANGQIVLVNPNGVFFSKTATVNAGGLFASALDISAEDFMAGHMNFKALENTSGLIVNEGTLKVIDGGTLALIGQKIRNAGLLIANFGTVALAAGSDISVRFEDQTHTSITVNANTLAGILELDEPAIFNSGLIQAHGGRVVLTARQAQGIKASVANYDDTEAFSFDQGQVIEKDGVVYLTGPDGDIADLGEIDVSNDHGDAGEVTYTANNINHSGLINADSVQGKAGKVVFDAADTTLLTDNSVVSAQSAEKVGGTVHALGNRVGLTENASINVSGAKGGGEVLIGGDYQGKNPEVKNAEAVYLGENTRVIASATENGNGGKIIVWSDKVTRAYGVLSATGGAQAGDGGFIETSSHDYADLAPTVDVHAENGLHGEWLIDPSVITISTDINSNPGSPAGLNFSSTDNVSNLNIGTLESALNSGANVTVQTTVPLDVPNQPCGFGTFPVCDPAIDTTPESLQVALADRVGSENYFYGSIILVNDLDIDNISANRDPENASSLTLNAHRDVVINGRIYDSDSDNYTFDTNGDPVFNPDGDILNLKLQANYLPSDATRGSVYIKNDIDLQGGNFTASGLSYVQDAGTTVDTRIPALTITTGVYGSSGFVPDDVFGATNAPTPGGDLSITATSGSIISNGNLLVAGTSDLSAATGISLNSPTNDFQGTVNINRGSAVSIHDANNLSVNINNNSVTSIATTTGRNSTITDIDTAGTVLAAMTVGGNLDVTSAGNITQNGVVIISNNGLGGGDGVSTFTVPDTADIRLELGNTLNGTLAFIANPGVINNPGKITNLTAHTGVAYELQDNLNVAGLLDISGTSVTTNRFTLGAASTLTLTSTAGNITQNNAINHAGATVLSASGDIFDTTVGDNPINNLANVKIVNAATASINNGTNSIVLDGVNATNLNVKATGGITDTDFINVTGTATLEAGAADIILDQIAFTGSGFTANRFGNLVITSADQVFIYEQDSINISGNMNRLDLLAGLDNLSASIGNVTSEVLQVTGATNLDLYNTGAINLTDGAQSDLQGLVSIGNNYGSVTDVTIDNVTNLQLNSLTVASAGFGALNLKSDTGITQQGVISVDGTTTLESASITLQLANDFNDVVINDSGVVNINDSFGGLNVIANNTNTTNSIDLALTANGAVTIEGELLNLNVATTAGGISNSNLLTVENLTTVNAGATGNVDFQTNPAQVNLENLNIVLANNVLVDEVNNLVVTDATVNGTLDIAAADTVSVNGSYIANLVIDTSNTISLSGTMGIVNAVTTAGGIQNGATALTVADTATLDAANSDITLANTANDIARIGIVNARNVNLSDANALQLMDITSNNLTINTAGDLSQAPGTILDVAGLTDLNSGNANINLDQANLLTSVVLAGNNVTLINDQSLMLNNSTVQTSVNVRTTTGNLSLQTISAGNSVTFSAADQLLDANAGTNNITATNVSLNAVNGIGMGSVGNDNTSHINLRATNLSAHNSGTGDINLLNFGDDITLVSIVNDATDSGNFNFETTHDVFIDNITLQQGLVEQFYDSGTGTVNMRTAEGSFLGVGDKDINNPDITATNLRLVGVKGTLGTLQRPLVLDISGKVELLMRASLDPIYVEPAPIPDVDIHDDSLLQFTSADTLAAANGVQLTEVETLLDIDPAIFTELRHFVVDADPVLLPRDQRFDVENEDEEEDEEYFRRISGEGEVLVN